MNDEIKLCPCGKPLHYFDQDARDYVDRQVARLGEDIKVTHVGTGRKFMVSRHFIALHGLLGNDLPEVAKRYGFEEVQ
jgi:hypothetical protein